MSFTESIDELVEKSTDGRVAIHGSWGRVKLSQVAKLLNGFPFASDNFNNEKGFPLIRIRDIVRGETETFYQGEFDKQFVVERGDLLIGMDGDFNCALWRGEPALLNQRVCKLIPDESKVDKRFLEYALPGYLSLINRHTPSLTVKHLSSGTIKDIPLPFPPVAIQQAIAGKIEELFSDLDAGVAALKRAQTNLKRYRAAVLKAAVEGRLTEQWREERKAKGIATEPAAKLLERILAERRKKWEAAQLKKYADAGKVPPKGWQEKYVEPAAPDSSALPELAEGWCYARVDHLGDVQLGRQRSPKDHYGPNMRPYLRVANVFEDRIDISDVMSMNFTDREFQTFELKDGDILLNEGQSLELVGRSAIYRGEVPGACFTNTLVRFRVYDGLLTEFAQIVFRAYLRNGRFQKIAGITVNLAHLGAGRFAELEFPLPSMAEQVEVVKLVEAALSKIDNAETEIKRSLERAARLRQAILKRAFEGRLV